MLTTFMNGYKNEDLYKALQELQVIDSKLLEQSFHEAEENGSGLDDVLLQKDAMSAVALGRIISDAISVPFVNLGEISIDPEVLHIIPEQVARSQKVIAFKIEGRDLYIASYQPENTLIADFLAKKTGLRVLMHYTLRIILNKSISLYSKNVTDAFDEIIKKNAEEATGNKTAEPPIIVIVDTIIRYAFQNGASDIHIEPLEEKMLVRFRIDGILHDVVKLPLELHPQIVTRVKVMSSLRTDEHQESQDGKISFTHLEEDLDIRVSIAPITKGEKIVMRLLSENSRQFALSDLGFSPTDLEKVQNAYKQPHGMILATGPTGSGKTTTLYAVLKLINKREINIMTIEDPVEYQIDNVNQIQVNEKADVTFAKGLRSIVRQDPDVILVGEIRDEETADIAINSSMTGHLVLSSLHTNDAVTTFPRLIDMQVEPYLVASTVNIVIAQRLVRKICNACKVSHEVHLSDLDETIREHFPKKTKTVTVYKGKGCSVCNQIGYVGRIGIYEVLEINDELREAITAKADTSELLHIARKSGMNTMFQDGIEKVKQGITTIEEVVRVIKQ